MLILKDIPGDVTEGEGVTWSKDLAQRLRKIENVCSCFYLKLVFRTIACIYRRDKWILEEPKKELRLCPEKEKPTNGFLWGSLDC